MQSLKILDIAPVSSKAFFDIQATTESRLTFKLVCDITKTQSQILALSIPRVHLFRDTVLVRNGKILSRFLFRWSRSKGKQYVTVPFNKMF